MKHHLSPADIANFDHLDPDLRDCLLAELAKHADMRVYEDEYFMLWVKTPGGIELPGWRLCEIRAMWADHVEDAPITDEKKFAILQLLLNDPTASTFVMPLPDGGVSVVLAVAGPEAPTKH
jgi:hypothetical protein